MDNKITIEFFFLEPDGTKTHTKISTVNSKDSAVKEAVSYYMCTYAYNKSNPRSYIDFNILNINYDKTGVYTALIDEFNSLDDQSE